TAGRRRLRAGDERWCRRYECGAGDRKCQPTSRLARSTRVALVTRGSRSIAPAPKPLTPFDLKGFLDSAGVSRRIARYRRGSLVFTQGAQANNVFYIQEGGV